jgi:ribosomal protein L37E
MSIRTRQCPECQAAVPLRTRYCPDCNALVNLNAPEDPIKKAREDGEMKSLVLMGIGGMLLFFSFGFFLPAVLSEPGFLWVSAPLFLIGATLFAGAWFVRRRTSRRVTSMERDLHVRCEYCGGTNHRNDHRCAFCGAPIIDRTSSDRT